jgi:4-hydroxy-2-oxoheptanedioate aldolase
VDAFFIGPNDLLCQMGHSPKMESDHPDFVHALEHLVKTGQKHGVAPGIHTANHEACNRRMAEGFRFMAIASDARFMVAGAQAELARTEGRGSGGKDTREVLRY